MRRRALFLGGKKKAEKKKDWTETALANKERWKERERYKRREEERGRAYSPPLLFLLSLSFFFFSCLSLSLSLLPGDEPSYFRASNFFPR
ncbi:hypothetical protein PUN28_006894 [Cardiocondyla obscurior]|uniref:Uncharacterized protein n=1 Tax=Cardiocondyla obscurior TaxID=286306 RepID=A0AAW2G5D0_9HYME